MVDQSKADATCNASFPDLDAIIVDTLKKAKEGRVIH
jgi:hypothetical protein